MLSETAQQSAVAAADALESKEQASIFVGNFEFYGPFTDLSEIASDSGIVAILIENEKGFELVDLYECENLVIAAQAELAKSKIGEGEISVAVHYTENMSAEEIHALKAEILSEFDEAEGNTQQ